MIKKVILFAQNGSSVASVQVMRALRKEEPIGCLFLALRLGGGHAVGGKSRIFQVATDPSTNRACVQFGCVGMCARSRAWPLSLTLSSN